ncbi:MAG TPA: 2OG-Fe(II) oxygenase [Thermoanaerobaculia bacterium]|jgi:Rps23 Pro-64 3,4-dihydroxylase Tpa1-like proline 4-hydroxylase|nr:2OG-Fe(II) oxygenase [Thermoanaerobaculia bacterium]
MKLNHDPRTLHAQYENAEPFPHIVLDGLFDDDALDAVLHEFPSRQATKWREFDSTTEKKLGYFHETSTISKTVRAFLDAMNSFEMLLWLEALTGIEGLIPDPYFGGGGLHQIEPGGFLKIHADFNVHPKLKLDRRLNMLIYLNRNWRDEYGGHLELWDRDMAACRKKILPLFNRTVIFSTTDTSFHGHPHPLTAPEGMSRKSVSLYYYTAGRPEAERSAPHDTLFMPRS